jgi:1-acyl-sn-glycerol-3-phosphate acyltransferase
MNVLIYPEGTRSRTGKMAEFKEGIGILAKGIEVPIVPIKLEGLHEILPVGKIWPKKGNVKIKIGKPIIFSKIQNSQDITKKLREIIQSM